MLPADGCALLIISSVGLCAHSTAGTLDGGAAGAYNTYWAQVGQCYALRGWGAANIRPGWCAHTPHTPAFVEVDYCRCGVL